jgi:hypothetical protein
MKGAEIRLEDLVAIGDESAVLTEVENIASMIAPSLSAGRLRMVFRDIIALFAGSYPGFMKSDSGYHDLGHTLGVFLATARLIHGAVAAGIDISGGVVLLGLIGSLFHDVGYIRAAGENHGTGAQFTTTHVVRGIRLMRDYFMQHGFKADDFMFCRSLLQCTDLSLKTGLIAFRSAEERLLGHMLGTADIRSQMADRAYLEKLLLLYREFREGGVGTYETEFSLLESTPGFFTAMQYRLEHDLGNVQAYLAQHFQIRWGIGRDLYAYASRTNMLFLNVILSGHRHDYRSLLRRDGIVASLLDKPEAAAA